MLTLREDVERNWLARVGSFFLMFAVYYFALGLLLSFKFGAKRVVPLIERCECAIFHLSDANSLSLGACLSSLSAVCCRPQDAHQQVGLRMSPLQQGLLSNGQS